MPSSSLVSLYLRSEFRRLLSRVHDLEKDNKWLEHRNKDIMGSWNDEVNDLEAQVKALKNEKKDVEERLHKCSKLVDDITRTIAELGNENAALRQRVKTLEAAQGKGT